MTNKNEIDYLNNEELADFLKLESPCNVIIKRPSGFWGAWNSVVVFINDINIGRLKNGKTITFSTDQIHNEIKIGGDLIWVKSNLGSIPKMQLVAQKEFRAVAGGTVQFVYYFRKGKLEQI
jgi:hypothetical protein